MSDRLTVVFWAGNVYDALPATDHHLARALARRVDVLWVDPPRSAISTRTVVPELAEVADGLQVLQVPVAPAPSRSGLRQLAQATQQLAVTQTLARQHRTAWATISCSARTVLPRRGGGVSALHVTDDWPAGAQMMGLDRAWLEKVLRSNVHTADVVSAVSIDLAQTVQRMNPRHMVRIIPNGATVPEQLPEGDRERVAVLVGQLNERLDVDLLEAVLDQGVALRILGPRSDRDPQCTRRLDALLQRDGVDWRGPVPHDEVVGLLGSSAVGITPYAVNDFNRASFPLKTLEYLAIGLPVVSTRLESLDWLDTTLVDVADTAEQFGEIVRRRADEARDAAVEEERRAFADQHSWTARADALLAAIAERA